MAGTIENLNVSGPEEEYVHCSGQAEVNDRLSAFAHNSGGLAVKAETQSLEAANLAEGQRIVDAAYGDIWHAV